MEFLKIKKQNELLYYVEDNIEWFCPSLGCNERCWYHQFFLELKFVKEITFMLHTERHAFFSRIISKYKSNHQNYFSLFFL